MNFNLIFNRRFIFIFSLLFVFSSCITNKDLEYIYSNDEVKEIKEDLQAYRLQKGDLLSVQISTTTEQQHDFFNKESTANSQLMLQNPYLYGISY